MSIWRSLGLNGLTKLGVDRSGDASPDVNPDAALGGNPRRMHILLAEDHEVSRKVVGLLIQSMGHRVSFAENGMQALAKAAQGGLDLVLMDIHMPVMDGLTCARQIRALPGQPGAVPMAALTADVHDELVAQARDVGMPWVLSKPLQKAHLETILALNLSSK